jgi:hypothetical protein
MVFGHCKDVFFAPRPFPWGARQRFYFSLSFSLSLCSFLPYERVNVVLVALICVPHDLGCVVEMYWLPIGRRSSDASRRPSIIPPLMRATYHLIVIDDFLRFVHPSIPRLPSPHIPCTYLLLLSLSFIACCFVIPPLSLQRSVQSALYLAP